MGCRFHQWCIESQNGSHCSTKTFSCRTFPWPQQKWEGRGGPPVWMPSRLAHCPHTTENNVHQVYTNAYLQTYLGISFLLLRRVIHRKEFQFRAESGFPRIRLRVVFNFTSGSIEREKEIYTWEHHMIDPMSRSPCPEDIKLRDYRMPVQIIYHILRNVISYQDWLNRCSRDESTRLELHQCFPENKREVKFETWSIC